MWVQLINRDLINCDLVQKIFRIDNKVNITFIDGWETSLQCYSEDEAKELLVKFWKKLRTKE